MNVWVVYKSSGYEGCSEPLAVFDSVELAEIFEAGAKSAYSSIEIKEMVVNNVA